MLKSNYFIVQYNDRYGNGNDTNIECIVESKDDFYKWLKQHNVDREADGNEPENEEEFDLISVELFK
jgi:hypothetical protein